MPSIIYSELANRTNYTTNTRSKSSTVSGVLFNVTQAVLVTLFPTNSSTSDLGNSTSANASFYLSTDPTNFTLAVNSSSERCSSDVSHVCVPGIVLPSWSPPVKSGDLSTILFRAVVYLSVMAYLLFGIHIVSDRMASAIEVITSQKRKRRIKNKQGQERFVEERIWHRVVGHLTIYVIGSSAPEIFLPVIEVSRRHFEIDELGPSLILGSAAFHLFFITGVCLASARESSGKPIKELRVFFVSAVFAIGAYLWLYLMVGKDGIVVFWQALLTVCFFPLIVFTTWLVETRMDRVIWRRISQLSGHVTPSGDVKSGSAEEAEFGGNAEMERRRRLAFMLRELKTAHPEKTQMEVEGMAEMSLLESAPKSAAFYRMQASKSMSGGGNVISKEKIKRRLEKEQGKMEKQLNEAIVDPNVQFITIEPATYTVMESCGDAVVTVQRSGYRVEDTTLSLCYQTIEGSAKPVGDYLEKSGTLEFLPDQATAEIFVTIIDDDEFQEDREFYVEIKTPVVRYAERPKPQHANSNPFNRNKMKDGATNGTTNGLVPSLSIGSPHLNNDHDPVIPQLQTTKATVRDHDPVIPQLQTTKATVRDHDPVIPQLQTTKATVRIVDDDHCGVFHFETSSVAVVDDVGTAKIKVLRSSGARGRVQLPFKVLSGSAKVGENFVEPQDLYICFENDQFDGIIEIPIIDKKMMGEMYTFFVELCPPVVLSKHPQNPAGQPILGELVNLKICICEDVELNAAVDRILKAADIAELFMSTTWKDQFSEALAFISYTEENHDAEEQNDETTYDIGHHHEQQRRKILRSQCKFVFHTTKGYLLYGISLPWKLLAASIPPVRYAHGWIAFPLLLFLVAFLSSILGDCATHFGCTVGMKDSVTAVTIIAFGMGLPDLFASRHAAIHEATADAAIGHITGSNAVNVFFGIGVAWSVASFYHWRKGGQLKIPSGSLGFGVTLYCTFAGAGVLVLLLRRLPPIRGELGGPTVVKYLSAAFFVLLWVTFVALLTLESYCIIPGF